MPFLLFTNIDEKNFIRIYQYQSCNAITLPTSFQFFQKFYLIVHAFRLEKFCIFKDSLTLFAELSKVFIINELILA